eukprot:135575-Karenia_brevis.AAC.1
MDVNSAMVKGRWSHGMTARIYLRTGAQALAEFKMSANSEALVCQFAPQFHDRAWILRGLQ